MKKSILVVSVLSGLLLVACGQKNKNETIKTEETVTTAAPLTPASSADDIVTTSVTDSDGNTLKMEYNNTRGRAMLTLNDEIIDMVQDTTASGVRMHNTDYDYEEWQGHIVLKKNGQVVFDNKRNQSSSTSKPKMTYDNKKGTATLAFNGETVTLRADTTASGLRFRNSDYEYEEWKGNVVLKKNGQVVFDSRK